LILKRRPHLINSLKINVILSVYFEYPKYLSRMHPVSKRLMHNDEGVAPGYINLAPLGLEDTWGVALGYINLALLGLEDTWGNALGNILSELTRFYPFGVK
jgi:hypothetical protein